MAQPATRNLGRLSEIAQVAVRHGFGYWFDTHRLTDLFPRRGPRMEVDGQPSQRGQHLREMLDDLGPTFVKFGQLLTTGPDVLPPLYQAARIAKERVRAIDFIDAHQLVDEFGRSIRQDLDYRLEARNADAFHHNFAGHPHARVPRVFWSYTRSRVLTLEWIDGTQVADLDPEAWPLEDRRDVAYLMTETWMTMIF